jgi:hypothetical protein
MSPAATAGALDATAAALFADYAWAIDAEEPAILRDVFTPEASFSMSIAGTDEAAGPIAGAERIVAFFAESLATQSDRRRHAISNCHCHVVADAEAEARAYLSLAIFDDGRLQLRATGVFDATLVRTEPGWRFAALALTLDCPV